MTGTGSDPRPAGRPDRRRGLSVRSRILASILIVAALGLASAGAITFLVQRDRTLAAVDSRLESRVDAARFVVTNPDDSLPTTSDAVRAVIQRVIPSGNESSLGLLDGAARFLPSVQVDFHIERIPGLVAKITRETADGSVRLGSQQTATGTYRYIAVPIQVSGDPAIGTYVVAVDLDEELAQLTSAFRTYIVVAVVALLAIALVGWFVAGRLLRPIRRLRSAASRITASDRRERIPVTGTDDVSELTGTINDMLDRLDEAITGQRRLLDDVRHELKTPITIVRGHLELLDVSSPADVEATRALAIDELDRMSGLVDDIESLAAGSTVTLAPVDVADLTADVFAKARVIPGHDWVLRSSAEGIATVDASRITQAWLQLADNAAKYSAEGTPIEIGSAATDGSVEFWVRDHGRGIPAGSESRIFERFGRADAGRGIRGSGLGLAIVQAIAVAHHGRVSLETSVNGSRFGIVVPGAASTEES